MKYIKRLKATDSTNKDAYRLAKEGAETWTTVVSETQTDGRGRLGKSWFSADGKGLFFSVILRPAVELEELSKSTLIIGLAVAEVLESVYDSIKVGLKWPNDIYINEKKVGGILVESSPLSDSTVLPFLIAGIGINVDLSKGDIPNELKDTASSLLIETGRNIDKEELLQALLEGIHKRIDHFERKGFKSLLNVWRGRDILSGKKVKMVDKKGQLILGTAMGVDKAGEFLLKDNKGCVHQVMSGDVRLAKKGC